jgi:putative transcriptional regulator
MKNETFNELLESVRQGSRIIRGTAKPSRKFNIKDPNVPAIRKHIGLSQDKFAQLIGVSVSTLRNWEQGRRTPDGAARVLLCIAAKYPQIVLETVNSYT